MDNLAFELYENQEGFIIDNDNKAEWALKKIAEENADTQRLINVCETAIVDYQAKIQKYKEQLESKTSNLKGQLLRYFETVPHKATKTQETYKLPSGTLKKKYPAPEYQRDNDVLLKFLKAANAIEFIKVKEEPDWAELKKNITVSGEHVIDDSGLIIDGVKVVERDPEFIVEV